MDVERKNIYSCAIIEKLMAGRNQEGGRGVGTN